MARFVVVMVALLSGLGSTSAEDDLIVVGRPSVAAALTGISESGELQFRIGGGQAVSTSADKLVRWSLPAPRTGPDEVLLADGSVVRLRSAWTGKPSLTVAEGEADLVAQRLGRLALPRSALRAVFWRLPPDAAAREKQVDALLKAHAEEPKADVVLLENGDLMRGEVASLGGPTTESGSGQGESAVHIDGPLGAIDIPLAQVRGIAFASKPVQRIEGSDGAAALWIGLRDGGLIAAKSMAANGDQIVLQTDAAGVLAVSLDELVSLQAAGPNVAYLSDRASASYRHEPYFELEWPYAQNRSVLGGAPSAHGRRYLKAIGMHSSSRLTYDLDGGYDRFAAEVAVDDAATRGGSVVCRVLLKHNGEWREAYSSGVVRGGDEPREMAVDLKDAEQLALVVDNADRGDERDYANWLDARLERASGER